MTEVASNIKTDAVVAITYSSRLEGENMDQVVPSRLSLMAFDAARVVCEDQHVSRMVIAGEQSYRSHEQTTGDALKATMKHGETVSLEVLRNDQNLLRNTAYQVDALVDHFEPDDSIAVVCWGFHQKRIAMGFLSHEKHAPKVEYILAEDVISNAFKNGTFGENEAAIQQLFRERYGLEADWPEVEARALVTYARRERITRLAMLAGKNGWLLKLLTAVRRTGRYDDVDVNGYALKDFAR